MPNQPGSAPNKSVSAKESAAETFAWAEKERDFYAVDIENGDFGEVLYLERWNRILTALRLLARVEEQRDCGGPTVEAMSIEARGHIEDAHTGLARNYCVLNDAAAFLSDLAALVAPTDAERK